MENLKIGIRVEDKEYGDALIRGLSHIMTGAVIGEAEEAGKCDVILTDRPDSIRDDEENRTVIRLSNSGEKLPNMIYPEVFMYSDLNDISASIRKFSYRGAAGETKAKSQKKLKIVTFSSVKGGTGVTTAAFQVAGALGEEDSGVLYMSSSSLDGSERLIKGGPGQGMLSLIYQLKEGREVDIRSFMHREENFDVLGGSFMNLPVTYLSVKELDRLLSMIEGSASYDYLLCDTGSSFGPVARHLYSEADMNVWVIGRKDEAWEKERIAGLSGLLKGKSSRDSALLFSPPNDPAAFIYEGERIVIDMRGSYGREIRRLSELIDMRVFR